MAFDVSVWKTELRRGAVELCLMQAVKEQEGYGYEIIKRVKEQAGIELTESTVYPILTRLANQGLLSARQVPSPQGPSRRYFKLTAEGKRHFGAMLAYWRSFTDSVSSMIKN